MHTIYPFQIFPQVCVQCAAQRIESMHAVHAEAPRPSVRGCLQSAQALEAQACSSPACSMSICLEIHSGLYLCKSMNRPSCLSRLLFSSSLCVQHARSGISGLVCGTGTAPALQDGSTKSGTSSPGTGISSTGATQNTFGAAATSPDMSGAQAASEDITRPPSVPSPVPGLPGSVTTGGGEVQPAAGAASATGTRDLPSAGRTHGTQGPYPTI